MTGSSTMWPHGWLQPQWPHIEGVHALFTTREGGASAAPFDSMNLGDHVHDLPAAVAQNRERLSEVIASVTTGSTPVFLQQVHGCDVVHLHAQTPQGLAADACIATAPQQVCTIMVADCLPVLFAHTQWPVVAAAHAGWRGLAGTAGRGVLEATVEAIRQKTAASSRRAGSDRMAQRDDVANSLQVWLGPCIGPHAFEVGDEVRTAFCTPHPEAEAFFHAGNARGKRWADLAGLARMRLAKLGITCVYGNDSSESWCTVSQPQRYFSHRRDAAALGSTGRMAACIWLDGSHPCNS